MHSEFKLHGVNAEELLREYVERRLHFALGRFGERIARVTTRISAHVGNRSNDLTCRITADLQPFGAVTAEASNADVYTAIDRCISRLTRQCQSKCTRSRSGQSGRASIRVPGYLSAA
jgi:ribosomal subunit interface protein